MNYSSSIFNQKPFNEKIIIIFSLCFFIFLTINSFLIEGLFISFVFYIIYKFLYRSDTPILFYALISQFVSVTIKLFFSAATNQNLQDLESSYTSKEYILDAFFLSMIGLTILTIGIFITSSKTKILRKEDIKNHFSQYSPKHVLLIYLGLTFVLSMLFRIRNAIPGINLFIVHLASIKFGLIVITFLVTHYQKKYNKLFLIVLIVEFIFGFAAYFSNFKNILIFGIIAYTIYVERFSLRKTTILAVLFFAIMNLAFVWSAIKVDYRMYLSGGERVQRVVVSQFDALEKIYDLVKEIDREKYQQAIESTVDRLGYIDFFSLVLLNVPSNVDHENGNIWKNAIQHVFTPRLLSRNKPIVDDSEHTRKYANVMVATGSMGASHSLGYMADSYIDFGKYGMFVPIFLLGLLIGLVFRFLFTRRNIFWGILYSSPFFLIINLYERNSVKLFSNIIMFIIVVYLFDKFIAPNIQRYIIKRKATS